MFYPTEIINNVLIISRCPFRYCNKNYWLQTRAIVPTFTIVLMIRTKYRSLKVSFHFSGIN